MHLIMKLVKSKSLKVPVCDIKDQDIASNAF